MKDMNLSSMINLTKKTFEIIENEYKDFLSNEKIDLINNINYSSLYKLINSNDVPSIYLNNFTYYLNTNIEDCFNDLLNDDKFSWLKGKKLLDIYYELVPIFCFVILSDDINFLKLGLIEYEIKKITKKYNLNELCDFNYKELEIAELLNNTILDDLPYNIIFLDSNVEIFNYLAEEKGIEVAKLYYEINSKMNEKYKNFSKNNFNLIEFLNYYKTIDYEDILDLIYEFVNQKIK